MIHGERSVTEGRSYSHALPAMQQEAAEKIDEALRGALAV